MSVIQRLTLEQVQVKIGKNKKLKQLVESFQTNKLYAINLEEYKAEILALHQSRSIRTLIKFCEDREAKLVDEVIRANLIDQGQRSRLTEILIHCTRASVALSEALKVFKQYCLVRYDPYLKTIKTKGEREGFLDTCLDSMYTYISDAELVINLARLVLADIDQGGFALKRMIDALSLTQARERRI
jgi:hypothetical protein